jgi:D-aminoacyl-tRNA deacylase
MRGLVQRVLRAQVTVNGETVGEIGEGLCVLVGVTHDDGPTQARKLAEKIWHLRVMDDESGVMNLSVADTTQSILIVSQFTLYGDTSGGRRPSWIAAARPEHAEPLVTAVVEELRRLGATVATGRFRTEMAVELINDGPVSVMIDIDAPPAVERPHTE